MRADISRGATHLVASDPETGAQRWSRSVAGLLSLKVVSHDGRRVALSPLNERYYLYGRPRTKVVIVGDGLPTAQTIELDGNFEPEAFSTDGQSLFVLQYRPARRPSRYQVRRLDLNTHEVEGVYTPDADLQEAMRGTARVQAASSEGDRLYTLYTVGRGDARRAFIHVLNLEELWAHCIDLPVEFARAPESAVALTLSEDGEHLYVANSAADSVADVDTVGLTTRRTAPVALQDASETHAVYAADGTLFVGSGTRVTKMDAGALEVIRSWDVDGGVRGLQVGQGGRLYVGLKAQIVVLDPNSGAELETVDPPGVGQIALLGRVPRNNELGKFTCAC